MDFPKLSLVLGGAASGKSGFSEQLVRGHGAPRSYIATAQAFDAEMREKILKHQSVRGEDWTTTESPIELCQSLLEQPQGNIILVDCLTLWLSNLMLAERSVVDCGTALLEVCDHKINPIVLVSNEVGLGIVPDTALGRRFRAAQGILNQQIAAKADLVVLVTAGLPRALKGAIPLPLS